MISIDATLLLAASATSALSYVGTLIAGVVTGAVGGALVTTSHERTERFRERMMLAATDYVAVVDEYDSAVRDFTLAILEQVREHLGPGASVKMTVGELLAEAGLGPAQLHDRVRQHLLPQSDKVAAARRRVEIVFPADAGTESCMTTISEVYREERSRLLRLHEAARLSDLFGEVWSAFGDRRQRALDEFTAAARIAVRRRFL